MINLVIENTHTSIIGQFHPEFQVAQGYHDALRTELGYKVQGADWSPRYKEGHWDGIISLYRRPNRERPNAQFPTGLIRRVLKLLKDFGVEYKIVDARVKPVRDYPLETAFAENGRDLRFYQTAAADKALEAGRGILALATGGGKTVTACEILSRAGCGPFLFYVPSLSLLKQTHKEFTKYLRYNGKPVKIGLAGGGICDLNPVGVNVVTYQTVLAAYNQKYQERGNKVVDDPVAGEESRKPLEVLESEYRATLQALNTAQKQLQEVPAKEGQTPAQVARVITAAVSKQKKACDKAKSALNARKQSLMNKEALRGVVAAAKGFIVDEAHIAAVVIEALGEHASNAYYRWGLSVEADARVELRGGIFGCGWVGNIEEAYTNAERCKSAVLCKDGEYDLLRVEGTEARGWQGDGFGWKPIKTFIRHGSPASVKRLCVGGDILGITKDHSVFRAKEVDYKSQHNKRKCRAELQCCQTSELLVGDVLFADDGRDWGGGTWYQPELADILWEHSAAPHKIRVSVNISGVSHKEIGITYKLWWQLKNRSRHGASLSLEQFRRFRHLLPSPSKFWCEGGDGITLDASTDLQSWAYWFGFYLGDGWTSGPSINFAVENERVNSFVQGVSAMPGVNWRPTVRAMPGQSCEVVGNSSLVTSVFKCYFGNSHCWDKRVPGEWIMSWSEAARRELLRGLLDSDGCVGSKNRHYITTTSHGMARDILSLLRSLGVSGSIHRREPAVGGIIKGRQIEGTRPSYQVHYSSYALAGENSGMYGVRQRFSHEDKDFNEVRLRDIKDSEPCSDFVYDFEMEGHPSFVANGILVHNSATAYREDNQEIRMEGAMGRKLIEISASDLTDLGYLVPARVFMIRIEHIESTDDYREVYDKHIKHCWERNFRIKQAAEAFHEAGRPTLILVEHVEHGQILESMIKESVFVAGSDKGEKDGWEDDPDVEKDYRRRMLNDCESGKIILIATSWAYTGVDAPAISTLVLAGTNKSAVTTYQQVGRVLRPLGKNVAESEINGKAEAIIVDFMDNQEDLHKHSVRRKKVYQQERAWTVKVVN